MRLEEAQTLSGHPGWEQIAPETFNLSVKHEAIQAWCATQIMTETVNVPTRHVAIQARCHATHNVPDIPVMNVAIQGKVASHTSCTCFSTCAPGTWRSQPWRRLRLRHSTCPP